MKTNNAKDRISRYFPYIVGGTAVVIRFFYLWSFWTNHPFSQKLISDARIFDDWALRIASGDWLGARLKSSFCPPCIHTSWRLYIRPLDTRPN